MNKYTEQQIEEKLRQLALLKPGEDSVRRVNQNIRSLIMEAGKTSTVPYRWRYYISAAAAVLLIGIGLVFHTRMNHKYVPIDRPMPSESTLTLAKLNAVIQQGGQQALNEYLDKVESNRQPRAEMITLQEIMKEL